MRGALAAFLIALFIAGAWLHRFETFPPTEARVTVARESVVACTFDRWTHSTACERVTVRTPSAAEETKEWLRQRDAPFGPAQ